MDKEQPMPGREEICKECINPLKGDFIRQVSPCKEATERWTRGDSTPPEITLNDAGKMVGCESFHPKLPVVFKDRTRQAVIALFSFRP